jgi:small-conductance mechanosensitive channel
VGTGPRRHVAAAVLLAVMAAGPALAQVPAVPPVEQTATAGPSPVATNADLQALITTLENDQARSELVAKLKALGATTAPQPEDDIVRDALDILNDEVGKRIDHLGQAMAGVAGSMEELPVLLSWLQSQLTDPISRSLWYSIGSQIGAAVLAGFLASLIVRALLRGWRQRLEDLPLEARRKRRVKASLAHLAVNLAALLTFLAVTYVVLSYTAVSILGRRVAGDILIAIAWVRSVTAFSKAFFAPESPRRRLANLDDAAAIESNRWVAVLFGLGFYGYYGLEAARRLGLPWTVHAFLTHVLFFVVTALAIWAIYRLRTFLGAAIERWSEAARSGIGRFVPWHAFSSVGQHVLAGWVLLVYLAWAVGLPDGAYLLTRGFVVTVLVLIAARAANVWLDWTMLRGSAPETAAVEEGGAEADPLPTLQVAAITATRLVVLAFAMLAVAQAWGVIGWFRGDMGRAVLATLARIGLILALVTAAAQLVQHGAGRYIGATDINGNTLYSNRTRTLVSMARNLAVTMLVAVGIVQVLSELGVNANALLAGAGVVGLAIGFGAQTLVKDLITGLFILVGDTIRVGDVVDLGGKSGVVEAISMRTVTLRAYNGDVHTIPFSSIDVVTNMTKDFSYYVFDIVVAYKEDVDRVVEVLLGIDSQLRREWPYRRLMLEPLEIAGVDAFRDSGVLVKSRTKVRAGEQWKVGREFNRRIKRRFDELGIEIAVPQQKVFFAAREAEEASPGSVPAQLRRAAGDA